MTYKHQKKSRKQHGNRTRGFGKIGAHRAKGQRGGTGLTTGKFKHKWSYYQKMKALGFPGKEGEKWKIGKKGFIRPPDMRRIYATNSINLKDVDIQIDQWVEAGKASKDGDLYKVNLADLSYNKLLGRGDAKHRIEIRVEKASASAIEKVKDADGEVILTADA